MFIQNNQNNQNKNFNKNNNRFNFNQNKNRPIRSGGRNFAKSPEELKQQLMPLYSRSIANGRTAMTQGDYVEAERHFQQAEHYMRVMNAAKRNSELNENHRDSKPSCQEGPSAQSSNGENAEISLTGFPEAVLDLATEANGSPQLAVQVRVTPVLEQTEMKPEQVPTLTLDSSTTETPKKRRGRPPKKQLEVKNHTPSTF